MDVGPTLGSRSVAEGTGSRHLSNAAAIVGQGMVVVRRGDEPRKTNLQLQVEAATAAMADAGIDRTQVGALFTGRAPMSYSVLQYNMRLLNELKVAPRFTSEITAHGSGAVGSLGYAATMVANGLVDFALCVTGDASDLWVDLVSVNAVGEADLQFEAPYGPSTPSLYAQFARRYMYETGATLEQCARVAVEARKWALHQPHAAMRDRGPLTIEDVMSSPVIASPLRRLDCAPWYPGGIATAVVVTRADIARTLRPDPIYLSGFGSYSTHEWVTERMELWGVPPAEDGPNLSHTGARLAAEQAYAMAGLGPADIDLAETAVPFTFATLMVLEEFGFCPPGQAGPFVERGGIDYEGGFPFNTFGGYLSFGQAAQGLYHLFEAVAQLRGAAPGRQVPNARRALVHMHGGPLACHAVVILSRDGQR